MALIKRNPHGGNTQIFFTEPLSAYQSDKQEKEKRAGSEVVPA
jgi:hypothetical protein